jgi:glutathione S-transferase
LNYKKIPYRTEWVEFTDIEGLSKLKGIPPSKLATDGTPQYTLPAIFDPTQDRYVSDSATIMKYLDKAYPDSPRAFPPGTRALQAAFLSAFVPKTSPIWPVILPAIAANLGPASMEAFKKKREGQFGKTLEEMENDIKGREVNWAKFKKGMGDIDRWMKSNQDDLAGPFIMGEKPVFVDFVLGGLLAWIRNVWGEESVEWTEIKTWNDQRWAEYAAALKVYEE